MTKFKQFDRVLLLQAAEHNKAGDVAVIVGIFGEACGFFCENDHRIMYVQTKHVGEFFSKCGHCQSCKHFHPIHGCVSLETSFFGVGEPNRQSCVDGWELSDAWAQIKILQYRKIRNHESKP